MVVFLHGMTLNEQKMELPDERILPGTNKQFPYVFVADGAFALKSFMIPGNVGQLVLLDVAGALLEAGDAYSRARS